jgi:hypothetical protein
MNDFAAKMELHHAIVLKKLELIKNKGYVRNQYGVLYKKGTRNIHCTKRR